MASTFTVSKAALIVENYVHVLYGTKDLGISAMTVDDVAGRITYPTGTTWQLELILTAGLNTFRLRGQDAAGNWTPYLEVELTLPYYELGHHDFFNSMDEHGLIGGLDRNPGEKNWDYRTRLLDYAVARTGSHIEGLFLAAAIELGIKPDDEALSMRVRRDTNGNLVGDDVHFEITPVYMYIDSTQLVQTREAHLVEPRTRSITMDETIRWPEEIKVFDSHENRIQIHRWEIDVPNRKLTFADDDLNGTWVTLHYTYRHRIDHQTLNLGELKTILEALSIGGTQLLEVQVTDETLSCIGLMRHGRDVLNTEDVTYVAHARVQVTSLENREYQQSLLNRFGAAYGTKLEQYARRVRQKSNMGWDELILDEGMWDVDANQGAVDFLPRLYDAVFGRWRCTKPDSTETYNLKEYRLCNGYCPSHPTYPMEYMGVTLEKIKSGPVESDSLFAGALEVEEEL